MSRQYKSLPADKARRDNHPAAAGCHVAVGMLTIGGGGVRACLGSSSRIAPRLQGLGLGRRRAAMLEHRKQRLTTPKTL